MFIDICKETCKVCGTCAGICPAGALLIIKDVLAWDNEKCLFCSLCVNVCPADALKKKKRNHDLSD